jgi:hypothetical protein
MENNISIQKLKGQRLTPAEKYIHSKINGVKPYVVDNGNVFWMGDDSFCMFAQRFKDGLLTVNYWNLIDHMGYFNLELSEIMVLFNKILYKYTDNGNLKIITTKEFFNE